MVTAFTPRTTPWEIEVSDFPIGGPAEDKARFLLRYAVLAPSGHNTQPWKFAVRDSDVLVFRDPTRRLPQADPDDRELVMSLGAAVMNLRVAAAQYGLSSRVEAAGDDDLVARVHLEQTGAGDPELAVMFPALAARRTWRLPMMGDVLASEDRAALSVVTDLGEAALRLIVDGPERRALEELIDQGDLNRMSDKAFRRELSQWMRPAGTHATDGMAGDALGLRGLASDIAPWTTRTFDMGKHVAEADVALAKDSAGLAVVLSDDTRTGLLDAGQLMERFVLTAALHDVAYSFFNLPVEVPALREAMRTLLGARMWPQLLLRFGYPVAEDLRPSARRPLKDVLMS